MTTGNRHFSSIQLFEIPSPTQERLGICDSCHNPHLLRWTPPQKL